MAATTTVAAAVAVTLVAITLIVVIVVVGRRVEVAVLAGGWRVARPPRHSEDTSYCTLV